MPRFTAEDAERAYNDWHCNCGPSALAAIMGMTLDEVRPHLGDFERKGYVNPALMNFALRSIGARFAVLRFTDGRHCSLDWPRYGLCRIQWEGPWTEPDAPPKWRYRQTHWVGVQRSKAGKIGIFDINCMNNGTGWCSLEDWTETIVPMLVKLYPRANGKWHITHAIEVERVREPVNIMQAG